MSSPGGETLDSIIFPDLLIRQKARGYRFTLDPLLLSGFIRRPPQAPLIDLGCGSGIIALLLARRFPGLWAVGLEIQGELALLARRSAAASHLDDRVSIVRGDLRAGARLFTPGSFGTVVCNPPYLPRGQGKLPPDPERAHARHEISMSLEDLVAAIGRLLSPTGSFFISIKPPRLPGLAAGLAAAGLFISAIRTVRSRKGEPPFLSLCRGGRATGAASLPVSLPPLEVYSETGYSLEVNRLLRTGSLFGDERP